MIDMIKVQELIIENPDYIVLIIEKLGFEGIRDRGKYIQFYNHGGDNPSGCSILKSTLAYQNFSHGVSGNIFTLIQSELDKNLPQTLEWCLKVINKDKNLFDNDKIKYPFNAFYRKLIRTERNPELEMKSYSSSSLPDPANYSNKFYKDGIKVDVQKKWGVRYSHADDAVIIPIKGYDGSLIGAKARSNDTNCDFNKRWWAYLPYQKTLAVYGFYENYNNIVNKSIVIVFESEKSVLQCASMGCFVAVAVAGHNISDTQARYIKSLMTERIIIAFDEGISEDELIYESKKLIVDSKVWKNKVGYVYDNQSSLMLPGSKCSPSDLGKDSFNILMKKHVRWINGQ